MASITESFPSFLIFVELLAISITRCTNSAINCKNPRFCAAVKSSRAISPISVIPTQQISTVFFNSLLVRFVSNFFLLHFNKANMNSIGGVILEQLYCPPERPANSPTENNNGGFFQHLRERVSSFTDSIIHRQTDINSEISKNFEVLDNMSTAGP
jgi:hypothetical protein